MILNAGMAICLTEMGMLPDNAVQVDELHMENGSTIKFIDSLSRIGEPAIFIDEQPYKPWGKKFRRQFR